MKVQKLGKCMKTYLFISPRTKMRCSHCDEIHSFQTTDSTTLIIITYITHRVLLGFSSGRLI